MKKLALAGLAAAFGAALLMPSTSSAAVTFGSPLNREPDTSAQQRLCAPAPSPCTRVGFRYPGADPQIQSSPITGVVVKFRLRSETPDPVTFRVARLTPQTVGALAIAGAVGPTVPLKGDQSIEEFAAQVPINAGDHLALDGAVISAQYANDGGKRHYVFGPPLVPGQGARGSNDDSSKQLLLQATVEPDSDRDGAGDETQDQCPTNPATAGPCPNPDTGNPSLTGVALAPGSFPSAPRGAAVLSGRTFGTRIFYRLSETARVTFTVKRVLPGRRVGRACLRPTRARRFLPRCLRRVPVLGSFSRVSGAGLNGLRWSGRIGGRRLVPGAYELNARAVDLAGNRSPLRVRGFRIVR